MALAALFVVAGVITLKLAAPHSALTDRHLLALVSSWVLAWGGGFALLSRRRPDADCLLLPPVALMTGWGMLLLARLAPGFLLRQSLWLILSMGVLCVTALSPTLPRLLRRYRYTLFITGLLLLTATFFFGVNPSGYGQRLWLGALGIYFQPSELLKIILVSYLAAYLSERRELLVTHSPGARLWPAALFPMLSMVVVALLLLTWQQDLGAALLFYLTFMAMLHLAWGRLSHQALALLLFAPVAVAGSLLSARVALRISIWLDPWSPEQIDRAYQILQSLFAMGAGGILGEGLGLGYPGFIPAVHTDFVYAALVEEFGMAGALALLAAIGLLIQRGIRLAQRLEAPFEALLAGGLTALLGLQTWVIIGGNAKLIPITGVTLPYLSYGGSSLLTMFFMVGLLVNLSASHRPTLSLPLTAAQTPPLRRTAKELGQFLLLLLLSTALGTGLWSVLRTERLAAHPSNPRRIIAETRIRRGAIVDRNGTPLADIEVSPDGFVTRTYPVPEAAPAVGYASLQYGVTEIEATCETRLRGDHQRTAWQQFTDDLLHHAPSGQPVRLTLDAALQRLAQQQLAGQQGAAVLVDARTGEILALASAPIYDPAAIDDDWAALTTAPDAPLLNRAVRSPAQPGSIIETVLYASLLAEEALPPLTTPLTETVALDGEQLACQRSPEGASWDAALVHACPAPFAALGADLGSAALAEILGRWGLLERPPLEITTAARPWDPAAADPALEALGQGELLVTPLQMAGVAATLANDGVRPPLHLLPEIPPGCDVPPRPTAVPVIEVQTAQRILTLWGEQPTGPGQLGRALAGTERELIWYLGVNSAAAPRYAVAVLLENPADPALAIEIAHILLRAAVGSR